MSLSLTHAVSATEIATTLEQPTSIVEIFDSEIEVTVDLTPIINYHASKENDGVIVSNPNSRAGSKPKQDWNIATKGRKTINGNANSGYLYSAYNYTGKNEYDIDISNEHETNDMKMIVYKGTKKLATIQVPAGYDGSVGISGLE